MSDHRVLRKIVCVFFVTGKVGIRLGRDYDKTVVLEKTLVSPLDCKEIKPVNPEGNQPWIFIGRTDIEAATPILRLPDTKSWLTGKDPDAGKDEGKEKGMTEDEMVAQHHWLNGHEFEQTPGDGEGQGNLACCSPPDHKESDTDWVTEHHHHL